MDQNSAGEEGALPSEIHLPSFSESQGLSCSNALNQDLGPSSRDLLYAGLSGLDMDPSLPAPNVPSKVLEDNLDAFPLYSGEDRDSVKLLEKYADPASQASLQDLRLGKLQVPKEADEGGRATSGSAGKEEQHHTWPQKLLLDCSVCGKVFSSTSSRSKHYLTHSQEQKHVCGICSKAFKRKDHLTRHMLTHQKTKPSACREQGCSKSYCDDRSLRQHYEVQHGLCVLKEAPPEEEACGDSSPAHEVAGQPAADGLRSLMPPEARSSGPLLPNREPLRSVLSSMVHQEISSLGPVLAGPSDDREGKNTACPSPPSLGPYTCTPAAPGTLGTDVPEECHPLWKEPATGFTAIHSRVAEDGGPHPAELERPPQQLPTLESWQEAGPSVDPPQDSKPKLTISNRIQDGNTYRLPDPVKEESMAAGRWLPSLLCRCLGVRHGVFQASETGAEAGGGGTEPPRSLETLDGMSTAPLGTPASEPVGPVSQPPGSTAKLAHSFIHLPCRPCGGSAEDTMVTGTAPAWRPGSASPGTRQRQRGEQPAQKAEKVPAAQGIIPASRSLCLWGAGPRRRPPELPVVSGAPGGPLPAGTVPVVSQYAAPGAEPHLGGVWAVFKHCSMSTQDDSDKAIGSKLDQLDDSSGSHVIKDDTKPHIRIRIRRGKKFQAEIPELQERPTAETVEHGASLVWKPSDNVMSNPETQDRDQVDDCFGICAIEDNTKPSIRPHIRIGGEFQAEIPELQERPTAETGEYGASLVWKPSDDVLSNPETQDRVTELCKMASSTMPGGGTNLELALHCLHEAQGDVPVALETLLHGGPQKPLTHPLANYHYAGTGARLRGWVCPASAREPVGLGGRLCLCPWACSWGPPSPAFPEGPFLSRGPQGVPVSPGWVLPPHFQCSGSLRGCAQPGKGSPGQGGEGRLRCSG
ncbi:zinc finger protein 541-like [Manis pentadactyla]|uniref:zinc finger protein 541-like n=1 Tax=Manis pentadactyla TaxID=143292 RepID=UPI00255CE950|nr:zinc finger protein 541-like [Manis pentadactyla]